MKRVIWVIIFAIIVVNIVGGIVFLTGNKNTTAPNPSSNQQTTTQNSQQDSQQNTQTNTSPPANTDFGKISLSDLSSHDTQSDCWIAYKGKVYDITSFLPKHPGSAAAITPYCGTSKEFEAAFSDQHGTSQVGKLIQESVLKGELG
jgi:cytochrome b involved in lipid metabolism